MTITATPVVAGPNPKRRLESPGRRSSRCACESRRRTGTEELKQRLQVLLDAPLEYVAHPRFEDEANCQELLKPGSTAIDFQALAEGQRGGSAYIASLYGTKLLTPAEESRLFQRFNYLKFLAWRLLKTIDQARPSVRRLDEVERLLHEAAETRNQIMQANLRLVVSVAKYHVDDDHTLMDLVSDGNITLLRSVEKFDVSRGFRFSTYATWALRKNFYRAQAKWRREKRLVSHSDEVLATYAAVTPESEELDEQPAGRVERLVGRYVESLEDRERTIVTARFGLTNGEAVPQTLSAIGSRLGISKERVRQLEARALRKLRELALAEPALARLWS